MSSRSFNKILTGFRVKKKSWIPSIKRRKGNKGTVPTEREEVEEVEEMEEIEETEEIDVVSYQEESQEQLYSIKTPASITNLPTEIYLQIFGYLLVADLFTFSCVSKFFRDLLWSKSEFTQSIWKNCRLLHYPKYPKLPPPDGMCEQQYIWITLAKKTCYFCKETYEKTGFDKWFVKINCCDSCMSADKHIIDVVGDFRNASFPRELKGCIPHTEYVGYINAHTEYVGYINDNSNCHKYYFIEDVEKIKSEYDSLAEEERQGWRENKRKELKDYLAKIKDYQIQDCVHYWSQFTPSQPDDEEEEEEEEEDYDDQDDQDYDQGYNQVYNHYDNNNGYGYNYLVYDLGDDYVDDYVDDDDDDDEEFSSL